MAPAPSVDEKSRPAAAVSLGDLATGGQVQDGVAQVCRQIAGRHRHLAFVGLGEIAGQAMQVHRKLACGFGIQELRQPGGNHPGEHIAGAAGRHAGIASRIDEDLFVGRGHEGAMALQYDVHVMRDGEIPCDVHAIGLHFIGGHANEPAHFAGMRRDDHIAALATRQAVGIFRERVEAVSVNHNGHRGAIHETANEILRAGLPAETGPDSDDIPGQFQHVVHRVRTQTVVPSWSFSNRLGHVLGTQ